MANQPEKAQSSYSVCGKVHQCSIRRLPITTSKMKGVPNKKRPSLPKAAGAFLQVIISAAWWAAGAACHHYRRVSLSSVEALMRESVCAGKALGEVTLLLISLSFLRRTSLPFARRSPIMIETKS